MTLGIDVFAKVGAVETDVLAELHERQAILGVIARVLVDPRDRHVEEARGVVDRQQFVAETVTATAAVGSVARGGSTEGSARFMACLCVDVDTWCSAR